MSAHTTVKRVTAPEIRARKGGAPIVMLTAYSALTARLVDPHADMILVGDSLAMVEHGMESTLGATLDLMILHGKSVMRGSSRALVVVDMPFGSYEAEPRQAFHSAARILAETGCTAVKLEGGATMAETIAFLTSRGIPVVAHIGLTPQSVMAFGGFKTQGRERAGWAAIEADAVAVARAGAFAMVVEGVVEPLAAQITQAVPVPTIGIGASARCDGQVLVLEDMLGFSARVPRFVRRFGDLGAAADRAIADYARAVADRSFPGPEHVYKPKD
ncbi:3-methyl-2-oxobutanoate hydroxymethyltransferase [Enterovirga sp.]|uniref:3-methyl-2-oxobutanoate hydroxymethyltransferase n=1 Tax=Enterovirga sp. TaxID=2026350 RepID=UPI002C78BEE9|nr:3-methyl-2-oxobutanoate hydroxymethyltransferase [Enterovirga sp.]HMO31161.1 3-methyl-2-oxobutanoate hydroxymethyltransferase [Enterovirga sp.]